MPSRLGIMPAKKKTRRSASPKPTRLYAPGYGFPKSSKGLLPWSWADQRLKKSHNYWVTTVKPDGTPHTMVVWGLWQEGRFVFSTGSQSRKARNLAKNPKCVICTEDASEAIVVEGIAQIADLAARRKFRALRAKVRVRYVDHERRYLVDERASLRRPTSGRLCALGKHFQSKSTRWEFV